MKGEGKKKKTRKVRVLRREARKGGNGERKIVQARLDNVTEERSAVAIAIRVHCFVE